MPLEPTTKANGRQTAKNSMSCRMLAPEATGRTSPDVDPGEAALARLARALVLVASKRRRA